MTGLIAAGDASPAAAVMALFLPRGEGVVGVVDALLESQQGVPLMRPAAHASRLGDDEEATGHGGSGEEEQSKLGNGAMHSGSATK
jgi:hypothetical protein